MSPPSRPRYPISPQSSRSTADRAQIPYPALRDDSADVLRRRVRHQPVDGHLDTRRHPPARWTSGRACVRPTRNWATPSNSSSPSPGCPTWSTPPTVACSSTARPSSPSSPTRSAPAKSAAYAEWMTDKAHTPCETRHVNEGQGDLLVVGLNRAGGLRISHRPPGTRRDRRGRRDAAGQPRTGRPALLSPRHRAGGARRHDHRLLPAGIQRTVARAAARSLFPDAIEVASSDAYVLGLNAVSDGQHVVHPRPRPDSPSNSPTPVSMPIGVDLSELLKGGGSVKCCTLEVHT